MPLDSITKSRKKTSNGLIPFSEWWKIYGDNGSRISNKNIIDVRGNKLKVKDAALVFIPKYEKQKIAGENEQILLSCDIVGFINYNEWFKSYSKDQDSDRMLAHGTSILPLGEYITDWEDRGYEYYHIITPAHWWSSVTYNLLGEHGQYMTSGARLLIDICIVRSIIMKLADTVINCKCNKKKQAIYNNNVNYLYQVIRTCRSYKFVDKEYGAMVDEIADSTEHDDIIQHFTCSIIRGDLDITNSSTIIGIRRMVNRYMKKNGIKTTSSNREKRRVISKFNMSYPDMKMGIIIMTLIPFFNIQFTDVDGVVNATPNLINKKMYRLLKLLKKQHNLNKNAKFVGLCNDLIVAEIIRDTSLAECVNLGSLDGLEDDSEERKEGDKIPIKKFSSKFKKFTKSLLRSNKSVYDILNEYEIDSHDRLPDYVHMNGFNDRLQLSQMSVMKVNDNTFSICPRKQSGGMLCIDIENLPNTARFDLVKLTKNDDKESKIIIGIGNNLSKYKHRQISSMDVVWISEPIHPRLKSFPSILFHNDFLMIGRGCGMKKIPIKKTENFFIYLQRMSIDIKFSL